MALPSLLQTLLLSKEIRRVDRLVIMRPTDIMMTWIGTALERHDDEHENPATIQSISLWCSTFRKAPISALAGGLSHPKCSLQRLDLKGSSFSSTTALLELGVGLRYNTSLESLSLSGCHLEDEEIALFLEELMLQGSRCSLNELDLSVNYFQSQATEAISKLLVSSNNASSLKHLNLSSPDVWDDRSYLRPLTTALSHPNCCLEVLDLSSNFLKDDHWEWLLEALVQDNNCTLRQLILRDNAITELGMVRLAEALPRLSILLASLDLTSNNNNNNSTSCCCTAQGLLALEAGLASNTTLTTLEVDRTSTMVLYYLGLNRGGRRAKLSNHQIPIALWPLVLARSSSRSRQAMMTNKGNIISPADVLFDLLHGPVLLDR
jgi:hypothetical protein